MKINNYKLIIIDGYIKGVTNDLTQEGTSWKGQPSQYIRTVEGIEVGLSFGCYKLVNNEIVFDENKCNRLVNDMKREQEERQKEADKLEAQCFYTAMATGTLLDE